MAGSAPRPTSVAEEGWRSFHFHYHGDLNRLLTEAIRGAVASLISRGRADSFFFIRYALGGPHVRLRVRIAEGEESRVENALRLAAEEFFTRRPSTSSLSTEEILETNRTIAPTDPDADPQAVYPDNSLGIYPFHPETERYGGPDLLRYSLDFFALSSLQALRHVADHGEEPQARQLTTMFRLLARQACGLAVTEEEVLTFADYPSAFSGPGAAPIVARADQVFEERRGAFCRLLEQELEGLAEASSAPVGSPRFDLDAAHRLTRELRAVDRSTRIGIGISQMHMTANRLGVANLDEIYLGRLLGRAVRELAEVQASTWRELWQRTRLASGGEERLQTQLASALAELSREGGGSHLASPRV